MPPELANIRAATPRSFCRWRDALAEPAVWGAVLLAVLSLAAMVRLAFAEPITVDEFEHLHFAWYVGQGAVPYRDFFEHHHPLLWYVLAPLLKLWPETLGVAFAARCLFMVVCAATAALIARIATRFATLLAGLWAGAIWLSLSPVLYAGHQVRPDPPMVLCLVVALELTLRGTRRGDFLAGIAWGIGFLFLQKAVLFLPVLALVPLCDLTERRAGAWGRIGRMLAGAIAPFALAAVFLFATHSAADWLDWGVRFNTTAPPLQGTWFTRGLWAVRRAAVNTNTLAFLLMGLGAIFVAMKGERRERVLLLAGAALPLCALMATRRPYYVYAIPALILPAILAGCAVARLAERVQGRNLRAAAALALALLLMAQHAQSLFWMMRTDKGLALQSERLDYVQRHSTPRDVMWQSFPMFAIHRPDAEFLGWMPFDMPLRAAAVGLPTGPTFENSVRSRRPAYVSLGAAYVDMSKDAPRYRAFLTGEGRYRYLERYQIFEREDLGIEARTDAPDGRGAAANAR